MRKSLPAIFALSAVLALSACGGSGSGSQTPLTNAPQTPPNVDVPQTSPIVFVQSNFVGPAVQGITAVSWGTPFETDVNGRFEYRVDDNVTFWLGGIALGTAAGEALMSPVSLAGAQGTIESNVATNVARFLQTLDEDADVSNGIMISATVTAAAEQLTLDFTVAPEAFEASNLTQYALAVLTPLTAGSHGSVMPLVSVEQARAAYAAAIASK